MTDRPQQDRHRLPDLVPAGLRRLLYGWHPGRARRWRRIPGLQRVRPDDAVLTFDDGPAEDGTRLVLRALDEAQACATFFVLGRHVLECPELTREIVSAGHELALHGYDHLRHDRLEPAAGAEDLKRGLEAIERVSGVRPKWFRPPFGRISESSAAACDELGLRIAYWSDWGLDWEQAPAGEIARQATSRLSGGAIVLLHDTATYGRRESARATAEAVVPIVAHGRRQGLTWRTLSEASG